MKDTRDSLLLPAEFLEEMASVLRVLAHAYRIRIIETLDRFGTLPVHGLVGELGGAQGALSQHLGKMRAAGLIRSERRGKEVWYAIANPAALTILNCLRHRNTPGESV